MKTKKLLIAVASMCFTIGGVMAAEGIQAYSHPTMFGAKTNSLITPTENTVIGGKIYKPCHVKTIDGKQNVVVSRYAKQMLCDMKGMMDKRRGELFDPKMPVLRSELAYLLSKGLELKDIKTSNYSDVTTSYWAKEEIDRALTADVMIGYPDATFKPDQTITKSEVLCTFAKLMNVDASKTAAPKFENKNVKFVPAWAYGAANEVIASGILKAIPNKDKFINEEYLSKEQVAYLMAAMKNSFKIDLSNGVVNCATKHDPVSIKIKLSERLSARVSNVGDTFTAKTTEAVTINNTEFPAESVVSGKVVSVSRPGIKNPGFLELRFETIKNGENCLAFPYVMSEAQVNVAKNPNIASRILAAPFSITGRTAGVAGRTISSGAEILANGTEEYLGNWSDAFCDTASLHPLKGLKSVGSSFITIGKGVYNVTKLTASGAFGVLYELTDEVKYIIVPNTTNDSCLNPDEELTIMY